ncbi:MAG: DUF4296 domain-containing protein [Paludibacteraceae bacterium]|nr:DUF4296 domain-containing protein [Paludibacteraceae bacterium]
MMGCRPHNVLSNREMRDLLYDLHRVDGAMQVAGYNYGHNEELASYYQSVLNKHGVTQAQFDSSLVWYTDNPQIFNKIYPNVIERLQADFDRENLLREERMAQRKQEKGQPALVVEDEKKSSLRPQDEVQKEYLYGIENPWKEWKAKEFCEKNAIIFGQLEKK